MKKSTIVLIAVVLITVILGGIAVYTAYLLEQRKRVTEEPVEAATPSGFTSYCENNSGSLLSYKVESAQFQGGDFVVNMKISNDQPSSSIKVVARAGIFHCLKSGTDICADTMLLGDEYFDFTLNSANPIQEFTWTGSTGFDVPCGRIQYDVEIIDVLDASDVRIEECNKEDWLKADIISTGTDCVATCAIAPHTSLVSPGQEINISATLSPSYWDNMKMTSSWSDNATPSGSFSPNSGLTTKYTVPQTSATSIDVTLSGEVEVIDIMDPAISPTYGVGHNAFKSSLPSTETYLSSVEHSSSKAIGNKTGSIQTDIYISNYNTSATSVELVFYNSQGSQALKKTYSVSANGTLRVSTKDDNLGLTSFLGGVVAKSDNKVVVVYEKIWKEAQSSTNHMAWGFEGVPKATADGAGIIYLSPVTNGSIGWGIANTKVVLFNPNSTQMNVFYQLFAGAGDWFSGKPVTIPAHGTLVVDINDETLPKPEAVCQNGPEHCWWTGLVEIKGHEAQNLAGPLAVVSEDYSLPGVSGSEGYNARGRVASYVESDTVCLMPVTHKEWSIAHTGWGYSFCHNRVVPTKIDFYNLSTGKAYEFNPDYPKDVDLPPYGTNHRDTGWIAGDRSTGGPYQGLSDNWAGAAIASTVSSSDKIFGGIQDLSDRTFYGDDRFSRATTGIPCDSASLGGSDIVYAGGLLSGKYGTRVSSINVFNPSSSAVVETITELYAHDGTLTATYYDYLKPRAMSVLMFSNIVGPDWYGYAKITGKNGGKIVAATLSVSNMKTTEYDFTCSTPLTLGQPTSMACSLSVTPSEVEKGSTAAGSLVITDGGFEAGSTTYTADWTDSPDAGAFGQNRQTMSSLSGTNTYTVLATTTQSSTTIAVEVTKVGTAETAICSDTITFKDDDDDDDGDDDDGDDDDGDDDDADDGRQPSTSIVSPVIFMTGGGAALAGSGVFFARSAGKIGQMISEKTASFEDKLIRKAAKQRKRV